MPADGGKTDSGRASRSAIARRLSTSAGLPGEMALQGPFGHQATQSVQQKLVRLVGHCDPVRTASRKLAEQLAARLIVPAE